MENTQVNLLDDALAKEMLQPTRRRKLLHWWIRIFIWIFMIMGCGTFPVLIIGLTGTHVSMSIYGLDTNNILSTEGLLITFFFFYKGIVAFLLWFEQGPAVILAIIDAIFGILVCCWVMIAAPTFSFRLELVALIPYLVTMIRIRKKWEAWIPLS